MVTKSLNHDGGKWSAALRAGVLFLGLLAAQPARASCGFLLDALQDAKDTFGLYNDEEVKADLAMRASVQACKTKGDSLTASASQTATTTSGMTCRAQRVAHEMNANLESLGKDCEDQFETHAQNLKKMKKDFSASVDDLDGALAIMDRSPELQRYCQNEVKASRSYSSSFHQLRDRIVANYGQSRESRDHYGALKETGATLALQTGTFDKSCADADDATKPARLGGVGESERGRGQPNTGGKSSNPSSGLTGVDQSIQDDRKSNGVVNGAGQ